MTQEEKAVLYDDLVREGDRLNRRLSTLKSNLNRTPEQESEIATINNNLQILEGKVAHLFTI